MHKTRLMPCLPCSKRAILLRHDPEAAGFSHPRYLLRDDSLHRPDTGSEVQDVFDKVGG
jgi:hypothetical protein